MSDSTSCPHRALAEEALVLADKATTGPWHVVRIPLTLNDAGREHGLREQPARSFALVQTAWEHGQIKRSLYIPGLAWSPFYEPTNQLSWMNEHDPAFVARSRELVPQLAEAVLRLEGELAALRAAVTRLRAACQVDHGIDGLLAAVHAETVAQEALFALLPPEASGG